MESFCLDQIRELAQALIKVQEQLQPATKDANNPFTKSKYATLNSIMDSCRDALLSNGIWLCQYPVPTEPGYLGLVTKLTHAESGQWQSSLAVVPLPKADPQGVGISMTYIRRYALSAMLGIVTEVDTDGEFTPDKLNRPQKQKNAVNASQRGKTTLDDSGQAKKISSASNRTSEGLSQLPHLDGVSYEIVSAQDGRECILATGNTAVKKEQLSAAGFHWSRQQKTIYAEPMKALPQSFGLNWL